MEKVILFISLFSFLIVQFTSAEEVDPLALMRAEHVMVTTNDYGETMEWYQDKLGFRVKHEWTVTEFPGLKLAYLERNNFIIEVVASTDTPDAEIPEDFAKRFNIPGIGHVAFLVDDVDAVAKSLKAKNVSMPMEPTTFTDSGRRLIFIEDNNGHVIEFLEELPLKKRKPYTGGEQDDDEKVVRDLTQQWLAGWDIDDRPFDAEVFRPLFVPGKNSIEVFDNVQGDVIVINDVDTYIATWKPFMEPLQHWSVRLDELNVHVSGDMAFTTFKLVGTDTRGPEGQEIPFGQYGTHVWRKLPQLSWRIVHEHLTIYEVSK